MKNFFTAALIATATLCTVDAVGALGAQAKMGTCHMGWPGETLQRVTCDVDRRVNANGHVVFDIAEPNGQVIFTVVLWDDDTAEIIKDGQVQTAMTEDLRGGNVRLVSDARGEYNFVFPTR